MKKRRIDPRKIVLGLMAKGCPDCFSVQHVWFASTEEFDNWGCPVCTGRIEPHEDYIKRPRPADQDMSRDEETESEEVPLVPEDSEEEPDEPEATV